jgi:Tol biopolymer transport system component
VRAISGSITDVFTVGVDGTALQRVTTDNADVLGVDWQGNDLVFASERAGGIGLWLVSATGGRPTLLAGGGAKLKHPSVARQSGVVAYEDWQYEINLREQPTDSSGGEAVAVSPTSDRWNFHPQISPDGMHLVFQSTRSGQYELWISDRDGSHARPLTRSAVYKSAPRWSPDSRRIIFTTWLDSRTELSTIDISVGAAATILTDTTSLVAPSFSRDGRSVYFGSLRSGEWQIWNVDLTGGHARQITTDGGYAAQESPDGRSLLLTRLDRPGLWRRSLTGGPDLLVVERFLAEQWPSLAVTDRGVFFVTSPDDGDPQLAVVENGHSQPRGLGRLPEYAWSGVAVSSDGATVIYAHADRRASNIGSVVPAR